MIDDGSRDRSLELLKGFAEAPEVRVVELTKNYGQHAAILAGFSVVRGSIVVTLDADLQEQLVCTATTQLMRVQYSNVTGVAPEGLECAANLLLPTQSLSGLSAEGLAAAGLVMNPATGEVLAYLEPLTVSGERLNDSGYQPGSLLTPIAAFSAFSRGYSPASLVWDIPSSLDAGTTDTTLTYTGAVNLRTAISNDYLNPVARLIREIGAVNVWRAAVLVGMDAMSSAPNDAAPLFAGSDTTLLQLGTAYSTFANMGSRSGRLDPMTDSIVPETVLRVTTVTERVLQERSDLQTSVILDEPLAYLVNHVLSDDSARWPSLGYPNELEIGETVAAKVGSVDHCASGLSKCVHAVVDGGQATVGGSSVETSEWPV